MESLLKLHLLRVDNLNKMHVRSLVAELAEVCGGGSWHVVNAMMWLAVHWRRCMIENIFQETPRKVKTLFEAWSSFDQDVLYPFTHVGRVVALASYCVQRRKDAIFSMTCPVYQGRNWNGIPRAEENWIYALPACSDSMGGGQCHVDLSTSHRTILEGYRWS